MENTPPNISAHRESEPASSTEATKALMLVVHIIGFASIWSIFQRSFFLHPLASFDLVQTTDELLCICVGMAISTAAILLKGKSVLSRNRQWLKVALAATAMGLIGGGVLVYCNEAALAPPALFAEAFCIVMGASSILSLYLWSVELIRYAYQTSFGWAVFSFFSAVFLARAATALVGNSLLGTLQILFSCPTSLALWALSAHASTIEVLAISSFEISRSERRFLIASIVLMLTMPLSHILLIGIPSFAEMSFSNDTREATLLVISLCAAILAAVRSCNVVKAITAQHLWFALFGVIGGTCLGLLLSNSSDAFTASAAINTTSTLWSLSFMLLYFSLLLFCYESSVNPALIFGLMFFVPQCIDIATKHFEFTADALPLIHLSTLDQGVLTALLVIVTLLALSLLLAAFGSSNALKTLVNSNPFVETAALSEADPRKERALDIAARHGLTSREQDILLLLSQGHSAARIGELLYISAATVQTHTKHIYAKLGVHSRQEIIDLFA